MVRQPFADFTWRRARELVAIRGADDRDQLAVATALVDLLRRAATGPIAPTAAPDQRRDRRVAARTRVAASTTQRQRLAPVSDGDQEEAELPAPAGDEPLAVEVVPFGVFDPLAESEHL